MLHPHFYTLAEASGHLDYRTALLESLHLQISEQYHEGSAGPVSHTFAINISQGHVAQHSKADAVGQSIFKVW